MKYCYTFLTVLLLLSAKSTFATHIVGGEFELVHLSAYSYRLNMILYFDEVNGDPGAKDPYVLPYIYRKSDDKLMHSFYLYKQEQKDVPYTNPECTYEGLETSRILYSATFEMAPEIYNDPEGYYIVWERCCRNGTISNISPPINNTIGQTYYLEFPPVIKDGVPFVNSSPVLFPPLSDYACLGSDYYVDFSGTDPDGDSLSYTLVTPLNSSEPIPVPLPKPRGQHQGVPWISGIDSSNMVPGDPPLKIDSEGLLRVTPNRLGLFVFAVLCEEFRDGEKIGEVRRDFQMLVIECPPQGSAPTIAYKKIDEDIYSDAYRVINFDNSLVGDERCLEFIVTDEDVTGIADLTIKPVNFKNAPAVFYVEEKYYSPTADTLMVKVCFSTCAATEGEHLIDFIGNDKSCPVPKMDTLRLAFNIESLDNSDPKISAEAEFIEKIVFTDSVFSVIIEGTDADNDFLNITMLPVGFNEDYFAISLTEMVNEAGYISALFNWDLYCSQFQYYSDSVFSIQFILDDLDACGQGDPDTVTYQFVIDRVENAAPYFTSAYAHYDLIVYGNELLEIEVTGRDVNSEYLWLNYIPENFPSYNYNITYAETLSVPGRIEGVFQWDLQCEQFNLETDSVFNIKFSVSDFPACQASKTDTVGYSILVKPPRNKPPVFLDEKLTKNRALFVGDRLEVDILARDSDLDALTMVLIESNIDLQENDILYAETRNEPGAIDGILQWEVQCKHLDLETVEAKFIVYDQNRCLPEQGDTLSLSFSLADIKGDFEQFEMPNVVTPNGDGKNDYFEMCNDQFCDQRFFLPIDDCENQFLGIDIYNRWGRTVYTNPSRNFRWDPKGFSTGTYFYVLKYTQQEFKGTISVI